MPVPPGYFEVERPKLGAVCSDPECPCPETPIPVGGGYLWISPEVIAFRSKLPAIADVYAAFPGTLVMFAPGTAAPILMCEPGARRRGLDMQVAAADARHWWTTGLAPLRPTPSAGASAPAAPAQTAAPVTPGWPPGLSDHDRGMVWLLIGVVLSVAITFLLGAGGVALLRGISEALARGFLSLACPLGIALGVFATLRLRRHLEAGLDTPATAPLYNPARGTAAAASAAPAATAPPTRPPAAPTTEQVAAELERLQTLIDSLRGPDGVGPGDINPGVSSNLAEAVVALRTGRGADGSEVSPARVRSGLLKLVEFVSTPEWRGVAGWRAGEQATERMAGLLPLVAAAARSLPEG
jgi:hypothetical protein